MPPTRPISFLVFRASVSAARSTAHQRQWPKAQLATRHPFPPARAATQVQVRWQSEARSSSGGSKAYEFEDIKEFISTPSKSRILVDTREPDELQETGRIPGAINIPITSAPDAWFITEEEFEDRFGFRRPRREAEVVFYCKAGVRSQAAARLAGQAGWEKVGEYKGSWIDWAEKGGEVER